MNASLCGRPAVALTAREAIGKVLGRLVTRQRSAARRLLLGLLVPLALIPLLCTGDRHGADDADGRDDRLTNHRILPLDSHKDFIKKPGGRRPAGAKQIAVSIFSHQSCADRPWADRRCLLVVVMRESERSIALVESCAS